MAALGSPSTLENKKSVKVDGICRRLGKKRFIDAGKLPDRVRNDRRERYCSTYAAVFNFLFFFERELFNGAKMCAEHTTGSSRTNRPRLMLYTFEWPFLLERSGPTPGSRRRAKGSTDRRWRGARFCPAIRPKIVSLARGAHTVFRLLGAGPRRGTLFFCTPPPVEGCPLA